MCDRTASGRSGGWLWLAAAIWLVAGVAQARPEAARPRSLAPPAAARAARAPANPAVARPGVPVAEPAAGPRRGGPQTFRKAKKVALKQVYHDHLVTFYCQHPFRVARVEGKERTVLEPDPRHYTPRKAVTRKGKPNLRASRVEWEHLASAHSLGQHLPCWRAGGRKACQRDPTFRLLESDLYNLVPTIGEVNGDRSNHRFGDAGAVDLRGQYGQCPLQIDFKGRRVYPGDHTKGEIARAHLYLSETYGIDLGRQTTQLMGAWHRRFPPSEWERTRARRIERIQGNRNRFVWD